MSSTTESVHRTAWLYTRGDEAVRLELQEDQDVFQLLVFGPGDSHKTLDFPSEPAVLGYQAIYERELFERGFSLRITADRRACQRRRAAWGRKERRRAKIEL